MNIQKIINGLTYQVAEIRKSNVRISYRKGNIIFSAKSNICNKLLGNTILDSDFSADSLCIGDRNVLLM